MRLPSILDEQPPADNSSAVNHEVEVAAIIVEEIPGVYRVRAIQADTGDIVPSSQQFPGDNAADESGMAGNEDIHLHLFNTLVKATFSFTGDFVVPLRWAVRDK